MYSTDQPLRKLVRPRSQQRAENAAAIMRDHLGISPTAVFRFDLLISQSRKDVMVNDTHLHEVCSALNKTKASHEPNCWSFIQILTLPGDSVYQDFLSRGLYAMLNLERAGFSIDDSKSFSESFLRTVQIGGNNKAFAKAKATGVLDTFWEDNVRCALRGLIGVASGNMAQIIAFLYASDWLEPSHGAGLALKFGVSTTCGNDQHMTEFLCLESADTTTRPVLLDLTSALTAKDGLSDERKLAYAERIEAICVLGMFRRSGDPQQSLRKTFGRCLRMVSETLDINYEVIIATLAASTGDLETYRQALLEFLQDQAAMSPVVAAGLYSIGSGDIKGIQELAELLDIDAVMAEGLVALAAGTPATTRGCLPGLLNSLELEEDKGMAILGLCSDDPQSIASLARCLTEARPDQMNALLNSLVCLPGLSSNSRARISQALDGLQSNSKLSIKNMKESVSALQLVRGNTLAVRSDFGMTKLELDLAVLVAQLFKFNASSFCGHPDVAYEPAQSWREHMPGQYCPQSDAAPEELGAETLFAHLQSGKLPNLFQRVAEAVGMVDYMPKSALRAVHEKDEPQHNARPWDMSATGTLMTGFFYAGITSRKSRLMEALDLDMHYLPYLEMMLEAPGGFREVLELSFGRDDAILDAVINGARSAEKRPLNRQSSVQTDEIHVKHVVSHILQRIMKVPAQLLADAPKEVDRESYAELQNYLREKLRFDCKNSLKFLMFVYRFGVFNLTPPSVSADHQSTVNMQLTLRWAYHDGQRYCIERPTSADERTQSFMKDVDWDKVGSVETVNNWRAAYFLAAQLIATCLVTFDDFRSESEFDVVNDGANEDYTNALRFRKTEDKTAILERRRIAAVTVTDVEAVMTRAHEDPANALARQLQMDTILRILEVADNVTSSSVSAYGPMFGGFVLGLVWNDVSGGHHQFMEKAATMLALPANCADILLALSSRNLSHPVMLPRFNSTFSPASSSLPPSNPKFQVEGDAGPGELQGCPPSICTDASGVPLTKVPVPGGIDRFFKEVDVPIDQMESMFHLLRVAMGDRAFLSLNGKSVCTKLKVNASTCFGLCAGAFLRSTNAYAAPDMNRVLSSVDRLAADLGVNDSVAAMAVCSAAGNVSARVSLTSPTPILQL